MAVAEEVVEVSWSVRCLSFITPVADILFSIEQADSAVTEVVEADSVVDEEATEAVEEVAVVEVLLEEVPEPAVASPSPARR